MATHDYNIANQGFPAFRADLNDALAAIVSNNSNATAPATTFAHMLWVDTAANPSVLKIRNADNDAWITIGSINQTDDKFKLTPADGVSTDTISELTSAAGVTVDGVLLKDSGVVTGAGTVSAPVYSTTGDTNTGIFFPAADTIAFAEGGAEAMRIDSSGNVGIGTTTPDASSGLTIFSATYPSLYFDNNSATGGGAIRFHKQGVQQGLVAASGWILADTSNDISMLANTGNGLRFYTNGSSERARITSDGDLLVGTTSAGGKFTIVESGNDYQINSLGQGASPIGIICQYNATPNGTGNEFLMFRDTASGSAVIRMAVRSNGGIANFSGNNVNLSDRREKTNFAPAKNYLDTICAIPVQTFNYIDQSEDDPGLTLGVVAQDVQEVAPELVMESDWGTEEEPKMRLSIYQTDLQYALMKSIQELKAINDAQASRIETLEAKVAALENNNV